jgi:hypothetical protein
VNPSELEILAEEIRLRSDFEREADRVTQRLIRQPPTEIQEAADAWVSVLRQQKQTLHTAAVTLDEQSKTLRLLASAESRPGFWDEFLKSELARGTAA